LTVVGDPDQSIYGWRSAKSKIFEEMAKEMEEEEKEMQVVHLMENYRSTQNILAAANFALSQEEGIFMQISCLAMYYQFLITVVFRR
jgi:DNA helicase-2/ATP-dependent DNA helicase PcrA